MYYNNNWRNPYAPLPNQTPVPKEKTIREELEEQFHLEEERQRQQSLIPKPDYSHLSLREELEARFRDMENEEKNQNMTPVPPAKTTVSSQSASLPKNWLNYYLPRTRRTLVPSNLNMTQLSPQQLYSSPLPYPRQVPLQMQPKRMSSTPLYRTDNLLKNMSNISYDYSENPKINDIINYAMTALAKKIPNPYLQKALTYHQSLYKLASRLGIETAQQDMAFREGAQHIIETLMNKDRENK